MIFLGRNKRIKGRPKNKETLECATLEKFCVICKKRLVLKTYKDVENKKTCSIKCRGTFLSKRKKDWGKCKICDDVLKRKNVTGYCKKCFGKTTAKYEEHKVILRDGSADIRRTNRFCDDCGIPLNLSKIITKCDSCKEKDRYIELVCPTCSKNFSRLKANCNGKLTFCSRSCSAKYNSKKPTYKDSLSKCIRRSTISKETNHKVIERDEFKCAKCGKDRELHIHHIKHFKTILNEFLLLHNHLSVKTDKDILIELSKDYKDFWDIRNLITLCFGCHQLEHPNIVLNKIKKKLKDISVET